MHLNGLLAKEETPAMHPTYVCSNDELTSTVTNGFSAAGGEGDSRSPAALTQNEWLSLPKTCLILDINLHLDSGSLSCWLRCAAVVFPSSFHAKCGREAMQTTAAARLQESAGVTSRILPQDL
jgi:hypothetical protein